MFINGNNPQALNDKTIPQDSAPPHFARPVRI